MPLYIILYIPPSFKYFFHIFAENLKIFKKFLRNCKKTGDFTLKQAQNFAILYVL